MPRLATILLLLAFTAHADYFAEGNRHFDQGNLPSAIASYRQQIATVRVSPALHYNLGNAYFQQGHLGHAIHQFHRARQLAPRDADIRANLKFARDAVHGQRPRPHAGRALLAALTLNEWSLMVAIVFALWLVLAALGQWRPPLGKAARPFTVLAGGAAVLLAVLTALSWRNHSNDRTAIVIVGEAAARHTPWTEAESKFTLKDGEEIRVVRHHQGWTMVEDQATRWGWLPSTQLRLLRHN